MVSSARASRSPSKATDRPLTGVSTVEEVNVSQRTSSWAFFLVVGLLSIPFWMMGAAGGRLPVPILLPISALMAFTPAIAALALAYKENGAGGAMRLLGRALDFSRISGVRWYLAALLLMPLVFFLEYGVLRLSGALPPDPQVSFAEVPVFFAMFFFGAVGEELGWQGFAFARLRERRTALVASIILGSIWALWHVIPFVQTGRSVDWIIWQCLSTVALRVVIVWLFVNAGKSVFIAVLVHTMYNLAWSLFPNHGSHYDPFVTFAILALAAGAAVALWGPATFAKWRYGR